MRRKKKIKRLIRPDPKYGNVMVSKFINQVMRKGKKSIAQRIVYNAFKEIEKNLRTKPQALGLSEGKKNALEIFEQAIQNVSPVLEVVPRRIGGAHYQIPREVRGERRITLAMRWIIQAAKVRKNRPMAQKLAQEFLDASNKTGVAIKKREDTHRMAEANRAFAHFA